MESKKPTQLLYRLIAGVVFTDIEARSRQEIETAAWKMAMDVGMQVDAERLVANMISHKVLTLAATEKGIEYYRHNLPNTLSHVYKPKNTSE